MEDLDIECLRLSEGKNLMFWTFSGKLFKGTITTCTSENLIFIDELGHKKNISLDYIQSFELFDESDDFKELEEDE